MRNASTQFNYQAIWPVYKPVGLSPLQTLEILRQQKPELSMAKLGYAGRLDPMAEGLLLVLAGQANDKQEELSHLDKEYKVSCILGITTDSYDLLGMPKLSSGIGLPELSRITRTLEEFQGEFSQPYPPYSAVRVNGKPMFWWAKNDRLAEIEIPVKQRTINSISFEGRRLAPADNLLDEIEYRIGLVQGDFRQVDILGAWRNLLEGSDLDVMEVIFEVECSSGTYVRSLVHALGDRLGCGAVTSRICRTRIGSFELSDAYRLGLP